MTETQGWAPRALIANAGRGWEAAWTLTHAASRAAAGSAEALPFIDAVPLLLASADLRAAEDYLEQVRRDLSSRCAAVDLEPADTEHDAASARWTVEQLVRAALEPVRRLRSEPDGSGSVELDRIETLLWSARRQVLRAQP